MGYLNPMLRYFLLVSTQIALVLAAQYLAFLVRFDGAIPQPYVQLYERGLVWLLVTRGVIFLPFHLYGSFWRYTGIWDLRNIIAAVIASSFVFTLISGVGLGLYYPRSVLIIDSVFLICLLGGLRLALRMFVEWRREGGQKRVLIYGAGDAGERIASDMQKRRLPAYMPIGFIDDDAEKTGMWIHGLPVLGVAKDLADIIAREKPDEVLVLSLIHI